MKLGIVVSMFIRTFNDCTNTKYPTRKLEAFEMPKNDPRNRLNMYSTVAVKMGRGGDR